ARPGRIRGPDPAQGKPQLDPGAPLLRILRARGAAVHLGDAPREGKAETEARRETRSTLSPEERVEHVRQVLFRDPRAPTPHPQDGVLSLPPRPHLRRPPVATLPAGAVQVVGPTRPQPLAGR